MREIKFRVWCEKQKFFMFRLCLDENGQHLDRDYALGYKPMVWQQYTGLKDKNGKEIYEGDIIKRFKPDAVWEIGEVRFGNGAFRVHAFLLCEITESEVIGNIYENPELLKNT